MPELSLNNKICLITGATSGIGKETALALAYKKASVVIVGRNKHKCLNTVHLIKQKTRNQDISFFVSDLSDLNQVKKLALELKRRYPKIDVLINNAGAYFTKRLENSDGYEMSIALNHLSPFVLTSSLIDSLKRSEQGRIINVSSNAHFQGKIRLDDLHFKREFNGFQAYAQSKLALVLQTYELARRLNDTSITVNAMHPGLVATNFGKNNGLFRFYLRRIIKRNEISPADGAKTCIYLATAPEVAVNNGCYFIDNHIVNSSKDSYDEKLARQLWSISENLSPKI